MMLDPGESEIAVDFAKQSSAHDARVLAVIPGDEAVPSSMVFARRQVSALERRGITVRSFFLSSRTSPVALLKEMLRFRKVVREFDPHIVHAHFGTVTSLFCAVGTRRPLVVSFRGSDLNPTRNVHPLRSSMARLFSQLSAFRASHVICVSRQLRNRMWLRSRPTSIIFDGVDLSLFRPISRETARQELGWSQQSKLVFFNLGGRPVGKRLPLAERSVDYARRYIPDIDLVAVTKVDPKQIPLLMNACDCLLLTSEWEGSPTVVKEALACNLPVVTVDVGDVKDLLEGVHPSRIVSPDAETLGHALAEVLREGERSNGRSRASHISEEITTTRVMAIYEEILAIQKHLPAPHRSTSPI